jgi:hypothetical protein
MSNYPPEAMSPDHSGRHPVNILHLVMGVIFLGVVTIWGLIQAELASTEDLRWLVPLPWVIAGAAGLLVITLSGRRRNSVSATDPAATAAEPVEGPTTSGQ